MNLKQRESLAKYAYDLSKAVIVALALSQIINIDRFNVRTFIEGIFIGTIFVIIGLILEEDKKE
jgi:hypothetical protein